MDIPTNPAQPWSSNITGEGVGTCCDPEILLTESKDGSIERAMFLTDGIWQSVETPTNPALNLRRTITGGPQSDQNAGNVPLPVPAPETAQIGVQAVAASCYRRGRPMSAEIEPTDFGTPERGHRKSERRQRTAVVSVRCSAAELDELQQLAALHRVTISRLLREQGLKASYIALSTGSKP